MEPSGAPWRVLETSEPEPSQPVPPARPHGIPWTPIAGLTIAAVVALVALVLALRSDPGAEIDAPPPSGLTDDLATAVTSLPSPGDIVVDVGGAVARPGVYHLQAGARIADAISAAGGYGPRVDVDRADRELNLAAIVHDGDQIHVPLRGETRGGEASATDGGSTDGSSAGHLVDLNRASAEELDTLPGIGPVTAAKIIAAREERPFASVDDLATRKVVGPATLTKIRALVTTGP